MLLSAEMYWQFSNLSPFSLNDGKSVHTITNCSVRWTDSFTSTFLNSSGCNCILSGKSSPKTLFHNFVVVSASYHR